MEIKKNPHLDISKDRILFRTAGLAFALALTYVVFTMRFFEDPKELFKVPVYTDDAEQIENTRQSYAPPPPPPPETLELTIDPAEQSPELRSTEFSESDRNKNKPPVTELTEKAEEADDQKIYDGIIEKRVDFRGGEDALFDFLKQNTVYPDEARDNEISGTVIVTFTVEKDGSVSNIRTDGKNDRILEEEAKRVIRLSSGMWMPGENRKKPVRSICRLPISFGE